MNTSPGRTHRYYTGKPLFPFGFGLSYANFSYANLNIVPAVLSESDVNVSISVSLARVDRKISIPADEVVQVYGSFQKGSKGLASIPLQQLIAFTRLHAIPATDNIQEVQFIVPRSSFILMSPEGNMTVMPGEWKIWVGGGPPNSVEYQGNPVLQGVLWVA